MRRIATAAIALLLASAPAFAAPILTFNAAAFASAWAMGPLPMVLDEDVESVATAGHPLSAADATVHVENGLNYGTASAGVSGDPGATTGSTFAMHAFAEGFARDGGRTQASAQTNWSDEFNITSALLPTNTVVQFLLRPALDVDFGIVPLGPSSPTCGNPLTNGSANASIRLALFAQGPVASWSSTVGAGGRYAGSPGCTNTIGDDAPAILVNLLVGGTYDLSASLSAGIASYEGYIKSDASHTLTFTLDPVGTGYSYVTGSGYSYLTPAAVDPAPVPEPASVLLLGSGLVGLGTRLRARRRQRS